jgi:hypothetical protein
LQALDPCRDGDSDRNDRHRDSDRDHPPASSVGGLDLVSPHLRHVRLEWRRSRRAVDGCGREHPPFVVDPFQALHATVREPEPGSAG